MPRLRAYWLIARLEAASGIGEDSLFIVQCVFRLLRVMVLLALWRMVLSGQGDVGGFSLRALLTYTLIQEVFAEQLLPKCEIEWALHDGGITMRFLQPMGLISQFTAQMVGRWGFSLAFFSLPLLLATPFLGVNPAPATLSAGLLFIPSLLLTITVGLALEFIFAALLTYMASSAYAISRLRQALTVMFSGAIVPLALLPWNLGDVFQWLPFASMASAPLRIYTGTGDPWPLLLIQLLWAVALWALAHWMWAISRERLVGYGG